MESIWKSGGDPSAWHLIVAVYFSFAFVAARFLLDRYVFRLCIFVSRLSLKLIYMCQCGFYMYSIGALFLWETRREGFLCDDVSSYCDRDPDCIFIYHKFDSSQLCTLPYRFFRIGAVILALHDAIDVFMEASKIFKYAEIELGESVSFGLFALSWLVLTLIYFPFWVIRASRFVSK
ncbi:LAG1 longevity assurance homolog 2 [Striga asiatica]|uniref:LAG1 longevity assurance homolog 2 n=1 Tax=Striga asiatica TaxID=4170 RepID=A0A5A7RHF0_STRAF|nr:LAG1 longevity assurance homolog 2 [Striga asiatica]